MTIPSSIKTDESPLKRLLRTKEGHGSHMKPIRVNHQGFQRSMTAHPSLTADLTIREGPADLGFYDESNTLGDCAFAPTQSVPISAPRSNAVAAIPLPIDTATEALSGQVIFFSNPILSRHRKKCGKYSLSFFGQGFMKKYMHEFLKELKWRRRSRERYLLGR